MVDRIVKRGDVYYVDFGEGYGSEQGGVRPAVIVQNNVGNKYSPTVIVAPMTSRRSKSPLPTHVYLSAEACGLSKDSIVLMEQIRTFDKVKLLKKVGSLKNDDMYKINHALQVSFGICTVCC